MKTKQDQELLEQYKLLSKRAVEDKGDKIIIYQANGTKLNLQYDVAIKTMLNYVNAKTGKNIKSQSFFKINKEKPIKFKWVHVSCSLTEPEKEKLIQVANKNGIKVNELLRSIILKVIESNK